MSEEIFFGETTAAYLAMANAVDIDRRHGMLGRVRVHRGLFCDIILELSERNRILIEVVT
jgi:hypothetical protein